MKHCHELDPSFRPKMIFSALLQHSQNADFNSWKPAFWCVWALKLAFRCERCKDYINGLELDNCLFHPENPVFSFMQNIGEYPCCGATAYRFHPFQVARGGCQRRIHVLPSMEENSVLYNTLAESRMFIFKESEHLPLYSTQILSQKIEEGFSNTEGY